MWSRLLYYDPIRHMRVWVDHDEEAGFIFRHEHTAWRGVLECNKEYVKHNGKSVHAGNTQKHMVKAGEIPLQVWMKLKQEGIAQDPKRLRAWLNDPDNRYFRTYDGNV